MRTIIVNRFYFPDQSATSRMATSLAEGLAARGHDVHVVASSQLHDGPARLAPSETRGGVSVHRVRTTTFGRARLLGRSLDYLTFHLQVAWRVRRLARGASAVIACTDPPLLSVTLMLALSGSRAALVNWLHDLFPEAAVRLGVIGERKLLTELVCRLRDASLRCARRNVTPIPRMAELLAGRGVPRASFTVVRQWSDGAEIRPVARDANGLRQEWGIGERFVVGYSGNFGRVHEFGTLLDAAERLQGRSDILFVLIGDGQRRAWVEDEVRRRRLGNVLFKPLQRSERLAESLGVADVHLVSLLPELEPCSVPSKFYGVLAAGRPTLFVGDPDGEIARTLAEAGCGASVLIGDAQGLVRHIERLAGSPALRDAWGARARATFERAFHKDVGIAAFDRLLTELWRPAQAEAPAAAGPARSLGDA